MADATPVSHATIPRSSEIEGNVERNAAALAAMEAVDATENAEETESTESEEVVEAQTEESEESEQKEEQQSADEQAIGPTEAGDGEDVAESQGDPVISSKLAKIARRERRQRKEHERRMAEFSSKEAEIASYKEKAQALDQLAEMMRKDPVMAFEQLGIKEELNRYAAPLYYHEMGEDAPAEAKEQSKFRQIEARMRDMESANKKREEELATREQEVANARIVEESKHHVANFLKTDLSGYGKLSQAAKKRPDLVQDKMLGIITDYINAGGDVEAVTFDDVADYLNSGLEKEAELFEELYGQEEDKSAKRDKEAKSAKTLTNRQTTTTRKKTAGFPTREQCAKNALRVLRE